MLPPLGVFTHVRPYQVHKGPRYTLVTRPIVYQKRAYIREHTEVLAAVKHPQHSAAMHVTVNGSHE